MDELLKTLPEILNFDEVRERPHAFISEDGDLLISGEYGDGVWTITGNTVAMALTSTRSLSNGL